MWNVSWLFVLVTTTVLFESADADEATRRRIEAHRRHQRKQQQEKSGGSVSARESLPQGSAAVAAPSQGEHSERVHGSLEDVCGMEERFATLEEVASNLLHNVKLLPSRGALGNVSEQVDSLKRDVEDVGQAVEAQNVTFAAGLVALREVVGSCRVDVTSGQNVSAQIDGLRQDVQGLGDVVADQNVTIFKEGAALRDVVESIRVDVREIQEGRREEMGMVETLATKDELKAVGQEVDRGSKGTITLANTTLQEVQELQKDVKAMGEEVEVTRREVVDLKSLVKGNQGTIMGQQEGTQAAVQDLDTNLDVVRQDVKAVANLLDKISQWTEDLDTDLDRRCEGEVKTHKAELEKCVTERAKEQDLVAKCGGYEQILLEWTERERDGKAEARAPLRPCKAIKEIDPTELECARVLLPYIGAAAVVAIVETTVLALLCMRCCWMACPCRNRSVVRIKKAGAGPEGGTPADKKNNREGSSSPPKDK